MVIVGPCALNLHPAFYSVIVWVIIWIPGSHNLLTWVGVQVSRDDVKVSLWLIWTRLNMCQWPKIE